jgi:FtsP/CotA-like multicopper oxidase with cupredoxin domain
MLVPYVGQTAHAVEAMQTLATLALVGAVVVGGQAGREPGASRELPPVLPNPNRERAGSLRGGVLDVALEAQQSVWRPDANHPAITIAAFSEPGKRPLMPGPLVRAPHGTEVRFSIRNDLNVPLTFVLPSAIHGGATSFRAIDSVTVKPGAVGLLTIPATVPGNYLYRANTPHRVFRPDRLDELLTGAIVIDSAGAPNPPCDRVFVIMATMDSALAAEARTQIVNVNAPAVGRLIFTINGRSWPGTERIAAATGDSLHWRILNASGLYHPMHLHGFYFRRDDFRNPTADAVDDSPGRMVVTQAMPPLSTMSMTWAPDRPGNWIFHCHFALHLMPGAGSMPWGDPRGRGMVGLVLEINVADHAVRPKTPSAVAVRHLRLLAIADTGIVGRADSTTVPSMRFILEDGGRRVEAGPGFSPEIDLMRGAPVSIMVVNHLDEPTSVHWHGIELEDAYVDGVPGVSGAGRHVAPAIAPGDSFEARFTPPRSGTFMYHAHVDEVWQQAGGLEGALIVREPGATRSPDDHAFFIKGFRRAFAAHGTEAQNAVEINGSANLDTVVIHAGHPARFRLLSLATANPVPLVSLTARPDSVYNIDVDSELVSWRPLAKDGFDIPDAERTMRPARLAVSIGETYDFEYTPDHPGLLQLEVRLQQIFGGTLLARVPIRVE